MAQKTASQVIDEWIKQRQLTQPYKGNRLLIDSLIGFADAIGNKKSNDKQDKAMGGILGTDNTSVDSSVPNVYDAVGNDNTSVSSGDAGQYTVGNGIGVNGSVVLPNKYNIPQTNNQNYQIPQNTNPSVVNSGGNNQYTSLSDYINNRNVYSGYRNTFGGF